MNSVLKALTHVKYLYFKYLFYKAKGFRVRTQV